MTRPVRFRLVVAAALAAACSLMGTGPLVGAEEARNTDLQRFLPNHGNSVYNARGLLRRWPPGGPKELWRVEVGWGKSAVVEAAGRAFTAAETDGKQWALALDVATGATRWKRLLLPKENKHFERGPVTSPVIDGDRVYFIPYAIFEKDVWEMRCPIVCLKTDGTELWRADKTFWATEGSTPLVVGDTLYVGADNPQRVVLVALDKMTGALRWSTAVKSDRPRELAAPASLTYQVVGGVPQVIVATYGTREVLGVHAATGEILWRYPYPADIIIGLMSTPVAVGSRLFLSAGEGKGKSFSACLQMQAAGAKITCRELYTSSELQTNMYNTVAVDQGAVFGFGGGSKAGFLHATNFDDGRLLWKEESRDWSKAQNLVVADGLIFALTKNDELVLAEASRQRYRELGRVSLGIKLGRPQQPTLANGRLYIRGDQWVVCYQVAETPREKPRAQLPAVRSQLAVIGGGSGGFGAALAAARLGVDVVLVERADRLGGNSVRGGVNCWEMGAGGTGIPFDLYKRLKALPQAVGIYDHNRHMVWFDPAREPYRYPGGETVIDPARRYLDTLRRCGSKGLAADKDLCRQLWHGVVFEPDAMAQTMLAMLRQTGHCRVLLDTAMLDAKAAAGRVESVRLSNGATLRADFFIDATGDGLLCVAAGCETMTGQEPRARFAEPHAPPTATLRVNGVTLIYRAARSTTPGVEPLPAGVPADCWWAARFPVAQVNHYPNGDLNVNMLPTMDGAEFVRRGYADAIEECRRRVRAHWHHWQSSYAEFREFRLSSIAPALGIRETRRIVGEYVLTEHDLVPGLSGQKHPDIVCLADHIMDTHGSHARGAGEPREPYGVPYRCLIPKGQRNLLVACRAASFSSLAASSCRLSRTMMQLGQAAGTAVALAEKLRVDLPDVPAEALRAALREQHVQLDEPMPAALRRHLQNE